MKRLLFMVFSFLSAAFVCAAEPYFINDYKVEVMINANGSLDVTENISFHFNEESYGFIRDIPCHHKLPETAVFDKTQHGGAPGYYDIVIRNVQVVGSEFSVTEKNGSVIIKAGTDNHPVSGDRHYTITYTLWGAITSFERHHEILWNIISNDWGCEIKQSTFHIRFAKNIKMNTDDVIVTAGKSGSTDVFQNYEVSSGTIHGESTKALHPFTGITAAIRLPLNYFTATTIPDEAYAQNFIIRKLTSTLHLQPDATIVTEEQYTIEFLKPCAEFSRTFIRPDVLEILPEDYQDIMFSHVSVSVPPGEKCSLITSYTGFGRNKKITVKNTNGPLDGTLVFTLKYKVWGAFTFRGGIAQLQYDAFPGTFNEPCIQWDFALYADTYMKAENNILYFISDGAKPIFVPYSKEKNANTFTGSYGSSIKDNKKITLKAAFKESAFNRDSVPFDIYARNFVIRDFTTDIFVEPDGVVKMQYRYLVRFTDPQHPSNVFSTQVRSIFPADLMSYTGLNYTLPRWSLMGSVYEPLIMDERSEGNNMTVLPDWNGFSHNIIWRPEPADFPDSVFTNEYRIFSILQGSSSDYYLNFPVAGPFEEPASKGRFIIHLPDIMDENQISCEALIQSTGNHLETFRVTIKGNEISGELPHGLRAGQTIMIKLSFPKACLTQSSFLLYLRLLLKNNVLLLLPLLFFFILYIIWYFWGRDKKNSLIMRQRPPEDITPSEAGFLWDNRLHRRDLVSLICSWAGQGYLKITEIAGTSDDSIDYELQKITELPGGARNFEQTIFSALFHNRNSVRISGLRNNFYCHMIRAHSQLDEYAKFKNFYVPGTRGFSFAMKILAWAELVAGMLVMMNANYNYAQILVCFTSLFVMLLVFGNIMPKRGHFGAEKYSHLKGFREFIEKVEPDQLSELLKSDPAYFDKTLSYAIVMGLGKKWAAKFRPLISEQPGWYQALEASFDTVMFTQKVIRCMHNMDHNLNYNYAQSSRYGYLGISGLSSNGSTDSRVYNKGEEHNRKDRQSW